jgi:hypothetical protein
MWINPKNTIKTVDDICSPFIFGAISGNINPIIWNTPKKNEAKHNILNTTGIEVILLGNSILNFP